MELKLRDFREHYGYTQSDLAKMVGKSLRTVRMWETGESYPNVDMLFRLCGIFDTDPNTMLGWYDTHPRQDAPPLTADESDLVDNYRNCTPQWKTNVSMTALAAAGESLKMSESPAYAAEGLSA